MNRFGVYLKELYTILMTGSEEEPSVPEKIPKPPLRARRQLRAAGRSV